MKRRVQVAHQAKWELGTTKNLHRDRVVVQAKHPTTWIPQTHAIITKDSAAMDIKLVTRIEDADVRTILQAIQTMKMVDEAIAETSDQAEEIRAAAIVTSNRFIAR